MELIRAYETSASDNDTDTDCSAAETQPQLLLNQVRSVYLVTYSQANKCEFPTSEYFAKVLIECFQQAGVDVVQWCCSEENHKHGVYITMLLLNWIQFADGVVVRGFWSSAMV